MKPLIVALLLLGSHGSAHALDGRVSLQWADAPTARPMPEAGDEAALPLELSAHSALVYDQKTGQVLLAKNADLQTPIASITKLMTAILVLTRTSRWMSASPSPARIATRSRAPARAWRSARATPANSCCTWH